MHFDRFFSRLKLENWSMMINVNADQCRLSHYSIFSDRIFRARICHEIVSHSIFPFCCTLIFGFNFHSKRHHWTCAKSVWRAPSYQSEKQRTRNAMRLRTKWFTITSNNVKSNKRNRQITPLPSTLSVIIKLAGFAWTSGAHPHSYTPIARMVRKLTAGWLVGRVVHIGHIFLAQLCSCYLMAIKVHFIQIHFIKFHEI